MRAFVLLATAVAIMALANSDAEGKTKRRTSGHHGVRHAAAADRCGGKDRWDVKDGSDAGALHVIPTIVSGITIAELNQVPPQPIDADKRMQVERVIYRVTGVLRLIKHDGDGDYHVVIGDDGTAPYSVQLKQAGHTIYTPASGHSIVVEIPDPNCIAGMDRDHRYGPSHFLQRLQESRLDFEAGTHGLTRNRDLGARNIPITVTGVLFFDFMHNQTGHALPQPSKDPDPRPKVVELHPVLCNDVNGYRERTGKALC